jgi:hypothetical protein
MKEKIPVAYAQNNPDLAGDAWQLVAVLRPCSDTLGLASHGGGFSLNL